MGQRNNFEASDKEDRIIWVGEGSDSQDKVAEITEQ